MRRRSAPHQPAIVSQVVGVQAVQRSFGRRQINAAAGNDSLVRRWAISCQRVKKRRNALNPRQSITATYRSGAPAPRRAGPPAGRLRLLTTPPDAEIVIDSRRVGVGSAFDLGIVPGPRHLEVRARGYETFDTTVVIEPGSTLSLGRVTLRSRGSR